MGDFDITFADKPGQTGTQFLFEIGTEVSADGAYPKSKGFNTAAASGTSMQGVTLVATVQETIGGSGTTPNIGTISELAECSDRGLDNGECECFDLPWPRVRGAGGACLSMCMTHDT